VNGKMRVFRKVCQILRGKRRRKIGMSSNLVDILVSEEEIERVRCEKCKEKWGDVSLERKKLYDLIAYGVNELNKLDGVESSFVGFNIWMTECAEKDRSLR
jgi:hypothetical protein